MREINVAWGVLRDPVSRRAYDEGRLAGGRSGARRGPGDPSKAPGAGRGDLTPVDDDDLVDVLPPMTALAAGLMRHLPWVALLVVFSLIFVVSAYARTSTPAPKPSGGATAGSCIDVRPGPETSVVPCAGPYELKIIRRVVEAAACPSGSEPRRFGKDNLVDCVVAS